MAGVLEHLNHSWESTLLAAENEYGNPPTECAVDPSNPA